MEKVLVAHSGCYLENENVTEVNKLLMEGWTVKSVTMTSDGDSVTAVFVLQKE